MHENLLLCLGLIMSVSFLVLIARKLSIPYPIFLVIAGLAFGFIPGIPAIHIDPNLVFLIILPPVLFDAAQNTSCKALWKWRRIISVMALGYVLLTATVVAFVSCWLIPGFTLPLGFLLGAIISPPDAAAATSVLQRIRLPKGLVSILEGESLLNDATSLTVFRFALAAIITNNFVWYNAIGNFVLVCVSGIAIGLFFGLLFYAFYKWLPTTANLDIALSFVLPYLIYLSAEAVHSSGVLAIVSGGVFISYQNHFIFSHSSRLKANAVWPAIIFILNAVIFFLIGLQLPDIMGGIKSLPISHALQIALIISLLIIVIRLLAGYISSIFTSFISRYITVAVAHPGWRNPMIISWAGMRGVVSLASALAIPLVLPGGRAFPHRDLILFITFVVIIVTLVGQGLALPWVIKILKPESILGSKEDSQQLVEIDQHLLSAAITELNLKYASELKVNGMLRNRMDLLTFKVGIYESLGDDQKKRQDALAIIKRFRNIMMQVTEHERKQLRLFRHKPDFDDDIIRLIERRLDLEEERLEDDLETT
jgi:CPA1 family monovalent cation:H+ antiporter